MLLGRKTSSLVSTRMFPGVPDDPAAASNIGCEICYWMINSVIALSVDFLGLTIFNVTLRRSSSQSYNFCRVSFRKLRVPARNKELPVALLPLRYRVVYRHDQARSFDTLGPENILVGPYGVPDMTSINACRNRFEAVSLYFSASADEGRTVLVSFHDGKKL